MSTHGALLVQGEGYTDGLLLYTHHTGNEIPDIVNAAPLVLAKSWEDFYISPANALDAINSHQPCRDWLADVPSVAALLIAARPCFLQPIPQGDSIQMPDWVDESSPWSLTVNPDLTWTLKEYRRKKKVIRPVEIFTGAFSKP